MPIVFAEVKAVLDQALADFAVANGAPADLSVHREPSFDLSTRDGIKNAMARGLRLIQPEMIGKVPKMGAQTNLVKALRSGIPPFPRMPPGGPYRSESEIQLIEDWIDDGCL